MRYVSLILFLLTASLCFIAGYKLGQSNPTHPIAAEETIEEAPIPELTDTTAPAPVVAEATAPVQAASEAAPNPMELRSLETVQTFFDKNGRELVAQVLAVQKDSLKVRRQSDGQELELPISMLSPDDQAFAAYLLEHQGATPSITPSNITTQSMEDKIWDELFN